MRIRKILILLIKHYTSNFSNAKWWPRDISWYTRSSMRYTKALDSLMTLATSFGKDISIPSHFLFLKTIGETPSGLLFNSCRIGFKLNSVKSPAHISSFSLVNICTEEPFAISLANRFKSQKHKRIQMNDKHHYLLT